MCLVKGSNYEQLQNDNDAYDDYNDKSNNNASGGNKKLMTQ